MRVEKTQEELAEFLGVDFGINEVSQSDYVFIDFVGENKKGFEVVVSVESQDFLDFIGAKQDLNSFYWEYKKYINDEQSLVVEKVSSI